VLHGRPTESEQAASDERRKRQAERDIEASYKRRQLTLAESANRATWTNTRLTIVLAVFTAISAGAALYQGHVAKLAAQASQQAAYAACVSSQIARNGVIEAQRGENDAHQSSVAAAYQAMAATQAESAVVIPVTGKAIITANQKIEETFYLENSGSTAAQNVKLKGRLELVPIDSAPDFKYPHMQITFFDLPVMPRGFRYPISEEGNFVAASVLDPKGRPVIADDKTVEEIRASRIRVILLISLTYDDIFGVSHWVHFCDLRIPITRSDEVLRIGNHECGRYNKRDQNQAVQTTKQESSLTQVLPEITCKKPED
jgi:hypothetical protein